MSNFLINWYLKVLIIEDEKECFGILRQKLVKMGYEVINTESQKATDCSTANEFVAQLIEGNVECDIVFMDNALGTTIDCEGHFFANRLRDLKRDGLIIISIAGVSIVENESLYDGQIHKSHVWNNFQDELAKIIQEKKGREVERC